MTKPKSDFSYSKAIKELQDIANYLEKTDVDLDEAIKKFERGKLLAEQIELHLKKAENTIKTIQSET